jgi:hypothetical protein
MRGGINRGTVRPSVVVFGTIAGLLALLIAGKYIRVVGEATPEGRMWFDFNFYLNVARQFLATGEMYAPYQLTGPYPEVIYSGGWATNLYPPPMVLLFAPFTILPAVLWWVVPLSIVAYMAWYWRPAPWSWPVLTGALALLPFAISIAMGNTILWAMAATALATRWPGAAVGLAGKPLLLPFAVLFLRRSRSWLWGLGIASALALLFLPFWGDWFTAMRNEVTGAGLFGALFYFFPAPLLALVPIIPWLARTRRAPMGLPHPADQAPLPAPSVSAPAPG